MSKKSDSFLSNMMDVHKQASGNTYEERKRVVSRLIQHDALDLLPMLLQPIGSGESDTSGHRGASA